MEERREENSENSEMESTTTFTASMNDESIMQSFYFRIQIVWN